MEKIYVGIDIAKRNFNVCLLTGKRRDSKFVNNLDGFRQLLSWLSGFADLRQMQIGMEATGDYWEQLALFLHDKGGTVGVIRPNDITYFAKRQRIRIKTDKSDAYVIALY